MSQYHCQGACSAPYDFHVGFLLIWILANYIFKIIASECSKKKKNPTATTNIGTQQFSNTYFVLKFRKY